MRSRKAWHTTFEAIDPMNGELCRWHGPDIPGDTMEEAQANCVRMGLPHLTVTKEAEGPSQFMN